jgi:formylglycine-generating enzyme required for sulfatase activity
MRRCCFAAMSLPPPRHGLRPRRNTLLAFGLYDMFGNVWQWVVSLDRWPEP